MGLAGLNSAIAGLRVAQQSIGVISGNIANVSTPGYSRKLLPQSAQTVDGTTVGVIGQTIIRNVDLNLQRDLWTQVSATGELSVRQNFLERVQQFHGPPDAGLSVAAEIADLRDSFSALADNPDDSFARSAAVNQAIDTANKINDLSDLITTLRNDAQNDALSNVTRINDLLVQIADFNDQIQDNQTSGRTTAATADGRDEAIKELSGLIDVSFFQRGDGVLVVQTNQGVELATERAASLVFTPSPVSPTTSFPASAASVFVVPNGFSGDVATDPAAIDITATSPGGSLGGLLQLRDQDFPQQTAQLDELAHKLALRTEAQGLRLFTDVSGSIPADTAPNATTNPATPVPYVGFAAQIQVNELILNDNSLLQSGTFGGTVQAGSNEVIRRVLEFGFGNVDFQLAQNSDVTTAVDLLNTGGATLQTWLGLPSTNNVGGAADVTQYASTADLLAAGGALAFGTVAPAAETDRFTIAFSDPDLGIATQTVTVDLRDVRFDAPAGAFRIGVVDPVDGGVIDNAAEQLRAAIQADIATLVGATPAAARFNMQAGIGNNGQLTFSSAADITIAAAGAEPLGDLGFSFLGLSPQTSTATDPFFDITIGNGDPVRITIDPDDLTVDLFNKLNAVPGLALDTSEFAVPGVDTGFLRLRAGDNYANPNFGGDIRITGGPFTTSGATYADPGIVAGPPAPRANIADGANIVSALFGTFTTGPVQDLSPVSNVAYGSETNGSLVAPIPTLGFRETLLGPEANISTGVIGASSVIDFSQRLINVQTQELIRIEATAGDEEALQELIQRQFLDQSAVNLDEELSNLIVVQTAFSASARVISAVDELFQELLNAIR